MKIHIVATAILLSGCATDPLVTKMMLDAQSEARSRPTLSMTCPAGGCTLTYHDPRDNVAIKLPTNGWDAATSIGNNITSIVGAAIVPAVLGSVAKAGFDALKGSGAVNTTTTNATSSVSTPTSTTNTSNANVFNANTTTNTATVGANSGANSGNTGKLSGTTLADATSTPTVVTQPTPIIISIPTTPP